MLVTSIQSAGRVFIVSMYVLSNKMEKTMSNILVMIRLTTSDGAKNPKFGYEMLFSSFVVPVPPPLSFSSRFRFYIKKFTLTQISLL